MAEHAERRRRETAQRDAQTRRQRSHGRQAEGRRQLAAERPARAHAARRSRTRVHADQLAVAARGHFAEQMPELAEGNGMGPSKLLKDTNSCMALMSPAAISQALGRNPWLTLVVNHGTVREARSSMTSRFGQLIRETRTHLGLGIRKFAE